MIIRKLAEQSEEDLISKINKVVMLQPNIAGIGVNINELIEIARHWLRNK